VWNATTSTVQELCDVGEDDQITSLSWSNKGGHLSVGTKGGEVHIWDINQKKRVRQLFGHQARVSSLAWNNVSPSVLASGSKDKTIHVRDLRAHN
jgi:cell division cycle 20-like protein 1 (cofactor of APC complex)